MSLSSLAGAFCFSLGPCSMNLNRVRMQVRGACSFTLHFVHCVYFHVQLRLGHLERACPFAACFTPITVISCVPGMCLARVLLSTVVIHCKSFMRFT